MLIQGFARYQSDALPRERMHRSLQRPALATVVVDSGGSQGRRNRLPWCGMHRPAALMRLCTRGDERL